MKQRVLFVCALVLCLAFIAGPAIATELIPVNCPTLGSCTANDAQGNVTQVVEVNPGDYCSGPGDTIPLNLTIQLIGEAQRYDYGLFVSQNGGSVNAGSACAGLVGEIPPFIDLDGDTCGDLNAEILWSVQTTVQCIVDASGNLVIPSCIVWDQNGNANCTSVAMAGTGSKCDCSPLIITPDLSYCATHSCDDNDPCTEDSCDETADACVHTPVADGSTCSDGNACTQTDTCQAGTCIGSSPVVCSALDQCHDAGTCDPTSGTCSNPAKADGSTCSDGNACTRTDTCQAGTCTGSSPLTCAVPGECQDPGVCDPADGLCDFAPNTGDPCNDGNACTQTDTCQAGTCSGSSPVVCTALDQCHDAGTCDPTSGTCPNPVKADGTTCSDGNACTQTDTCQAGTCSGLNTVVCTALDQCHDAGTCDPTSGTCPNPVKADGTTCSDGNACTTGDTCSAGVCVGETGSNCSDKNICNGIETCDPIGGCQAGTPLTCEDSNVCTTDICDVILGCQHLYNMNPCNDGNSCTTVDTCALGICVGGGADPGCGYTVDSDGGVAGGGGTVEEPVPEDHPEAGVEVPDEDLEPVNAQPGDKKGSVDTPGTVLTDDIKPYDGSIGADSPLYGLKLALEDLDLSFTADETERVDKQMIHARLRLSEVRRSLDLNQSDAAELALNNYWLKLDLTNLTLARWNSSVTGLLPAEEMIVRHEFVLENLLASHPDNTGLQRAYSNSLALEEKFVEKTAIIYQRTIDQNNRIIFRAIGLEQNNRTG